MVIVGDAPFVLDSIIDARAKARHPSNVRDRDAGLLYRRRRHACGAFFGISTVGVVDLPACTNWGRRKPPTSLKINVDARFRAASGKKYF